MKPEQIRPDVFVYRCTDCSAPLFIVYYEIAAWPTDREALCFDCFNDRCEVATFVGATHLHTTDISKAIIESPRNEEHIWANSFAIDVTLRQYKKRFNEAKASEAEADIDDIF